METTSPPETNDKQQPVQYTKEKSTKMNKTKKLNIRTEKMKQLMRCWKYYLVLVLSSVKLRLRL